MLNHFKRKLTKLAARGKARTDTSQVRCLVERLEERTMLSASYGTPAHGYGAPDFGPHSGASQQRYGNSAAFASQQPRSMSYDSQTFYSVRETGPGYRDFQSHPTMQSAFAPPQRISGGGQLRPSEPGWNQFGAAPPRDDPYSYFGEPGYSPYVSYVEPEPTYTLIIYHFEYSTPIVQENQPPNFAETNDIVPPTASRLQAPPNGSGGPAGGGIDPRQTNGQINHNPSQAEVESIVNLNGSNFNNRTGPNYVLANVGSAFSDLPAASQSFSRDATTTTVLNAVAREVAFQEFSPSLFQANATTAYDRVNVNAIGADAMQSELVDGWIHPADESTVDVSAKSSDAVVRERAAVDAVLEELEDVDTLLPASAFQDISSELNLQTETALDDLPAGEVDGGMVLLQATGDANASGFDLTPVYAEHVGRFNMPAKMETSVGMFQAMDVASDDAPIIETVQQTESPAQLKHDSQLEDKLPTKRQQSSTNKAATVIGVTTLTGALVWMNRNGSRITRPKPTAQKRRDSRD